MNQIEFIRKAVETALVQEGFNQAQAVRYAEDAVLHFKSASKFKNGAYADCLNHARNLAKQGCSR